MRFFAVSLQKIWLQFYQAIVLFIVISSSIISMTTTGHEYELVPTEKQ